MDPSSVGITLIDSKIKEVKEDKNNSICWCLFKNLDDVIEHVASGSLKSIDNETESREGLWWQRKYCQDANTIYYAFYRSIDYIKQKGKDFTLLIYIPTDTRGLHHFETVTAHTKNLLDAIGTETIPKTFIALIEPSIGRKLWETPRGNRKKWTEEITKATKQASLVSKTTQLDPQYRRSMLSGVISDLPALPKTDIVIFLSSTFLDTRNERDVYWDDVHPYLVSLCRQIGLSYVAVDMRWGVKHIAGDNHKTLQLCMDNVNYCRQNSVGAYFVSILGQRRGYEPIPPSIEHDLFHELLRLIEDESLSSEQSKLALQNIKEWYKLDKNLQPPCYILQNISWKYGKYKKIPQAWWDTYKIMQQALKKSSYRLPSKFSDVAYKFQVPITESEVEEGVLKDSIPKEFSKKCFMFDISVSGIDPKDDAAKNFADITDNDGVKKIDTEALSSMNSFKDRLRNVLSPEHTRQFQPKWNKEGINAEQNPDYLREFADTFCQFMVDSAVDGIRNANITSDEIYLESLQHNIVWNYNSEEFVGGKPTLKRIKNIISDSPIMPLILHGPSGCGKTFFMSKVSMQVAKEMGFDCCIVLYLGTSPGSSSAHAVMTTLCQRLLSILNISTDQIPKKFDELMEYLQKLLKELEKLDTRPRICLALDALDQLTDEDSGRDLKWLPKHLPSNILLLVSTIHELHPSRRLPHIERCFEALEEANIPAQNFIQIPELKKDDIVDIIEHWLEKDNRKLTDYQFSSLVSAAENSPNPLFLKLAYAEALKWHSYTPESAAYIPTSISGILDSMFDELEQHHGRMLVSHAFAYLTATKHGLSVNELQDILSCDEMVLDEVFEYFSPPIRRIPPHVWLSLQAAMGPYMVERGAQGETVYGWYHRQFWEKVQERYLNRDDHRRSTDVISAYFLGELEGNLPYIDKKTGFQVSVSRNVTSQKLFLLEGDRRHEQNPVYNIRKMVELPHALIAARRANDLEDLLCDVEFMSAMFMMNMHHDLIDIMLEASNDLLATSTKLEVFSQFVQANAVELYKNPFLVVQECLNDSDQSFLHKEAIKHLDRPPKENENAIFVYLNKKQGEDPALFSLKAIYEPSAHARIFDVKLIGKDVGLAVSFGVTNIYVDYGTVRTFDAMNGKELATLVQGKKIGQSSLCCTADGKYLSYQADDTVYFADVEDVAHPKKVFEYRVGTVMVQTSVSSAGDFLLYHMNSKNSFEIISPGTWTMTQKEIACCTPFLSTVCYTDDGNLLFCMKNTGRQDKEPVLEIDLIHPEIIEKAGKTVNCEAVYQSYNENMQPSEAENLSRREGGLKGWITKLYRTVALSKDGTLAALGFWNGTIHVFNLKTGEVVIVLKRPQNENEGKHLYDENWNVLDIKFSPDDSLLFATYGDETFRVYNTKTWEEDFMLTSFGNSCCVADVSMDNNILIVVNFGNHKIQRIDMSLLRLSSEINKDIPFFSTKVWQNSVIQFSSDGSTVSMVVAKFSKIIDTNTGICLESTEFNSKFAVKAGSNSTAVFPQENNLVLKEIKKDTPCKELCTFEMSEGKSPLVCSFLPKSGNVVILTTDSGLAIYCGKTGTLEKECGMTFEQVLDIRCTFHENIGERIAIISRSQSIYLLNASSLELLTQVKGFNSSSYGRTDSFCVSSCGRGMSTRGSMKGSMVAIVMSDKVDTYKMEEVITTQYLAATAVCPDKMLLAAAGWNGDMNLFDLKTRKAVKQLSNAETKINTSKSMCFSPDGKYLLSIGGDGSTLADGGHVRLWNANNLQLLGLFNSESGTNMTCMDVHWSSTKVGEEDTDSDIVAKVACLDWVGRIYILNVRDRLTHRL